MNKEARPRSAVLAQGAVVNKQEKNNQNPLLLVMGRNWFEFVRVLKHGIDSIVENNNSKTPLHVLVRTLIL